MRLERSSVALCMQRLDTLIDCDWASAVFSVFLETLTVDFMAL